jgi:hypothetical protein
MTRGHTVAQRVRRRPLTTQVGVRFQASECEIYGEQSGKRTGFPPFTSVSSSQYHCTSVPYSFIHHQITRAAWCWQLTAWLNKTQKVTQTRVYICIQYTLCKKCRFFNVNIREVVEQVATTGMNCAINRQKCVVRQQSKLFNTWLLPLETLFLSGSNPYKSDNTDKLTSDR